MDLPIDLSKMIRLATDAAAKTGDERTIEDDDVRAVIAEADTNGNGKVSRAEFKDSLERKGFTFAERQAAAMFVYGAFGSNMGFDQACKVLRDNASQIESIGIKVGVSR